MEKIKLKDSTEIEIIGATSTSISIKASTSQMFTDAYAKLNESNLEQYTIVNELNEVLAVYNDKVIKSAKLEDGVAIFDLKDVDIVAKRIKALEDTVDTLVMESLGV